MGDRCFTIISPCGRHTHTQLMVPRLCLALIFVTALGGTWAVEQPENSMLEYFPPFQALLAALYQAFGGSAVPTLQKLA